MRKVGRSQKLVSGRDEKRLQFLPRQDLGGKAVSLLLLPRCKVTIVLHTFVGRGTAEVPWA